MWTKWLPWRFVLSHLARSRGFIDPIALLGRLHRFSQPSEVAEPIELLRAGVLFHARGLINARTIQHNLDWVWPFWIERQFDPHDPAFVPRSFSITHVNLTHRNWTAVGQPDCDCLPIVDPRGLVTPSFDGWSVDTWIMPDEGEALLPSRAKEAEQHLLMDEGLAVETLLRENGLGLRNKVDVVLERDGPVARLDIQGNAETPAWLVVAVRPVNPEGVSFIHEAEFDPCGPKLIIDGDDLIEVSSSPDGVHMSEYRRGDVLQDVRLRDGEVGTTHRVSCEVGLATVAMLFRMQPREEKQILLRMPLDERAASQQVSRHVATARKTRRGPADWQRELAQTCRIEVPDERLKLLFDAAVRNLILHSPNEVYAGPYTYKRFWFRDAAFILNALLALGLFERVRRIIDTYPSRQRTGGYFCSQEGEWDSNGEAIWIIDQYRRASGERLSEELIDSVEKGTRWIRRKRLSDDLSEPHAGLLPAGFSAEHLGPNDYYYWDDFWGVAGLRSGARILDHASRTEPAQTAREEADRMMQAIERSIDRTHSARERRGVPASPYRRMDSGAIGSLPVGYPLQLWASDDSRLLETADFLLDNCMVDGGFFQDMIHSGINAYLTLHLAQVLLRGGDERHWHLTRRVAELASSTGQWPEAIHPSTGGGCMGDGQHMWAAAEWILIMRNSFVREENDRLVIGSGLPREWLTHGETLRLGTTPTSHGAVQVAVEPTEDHLQVSWDVAWHGEPVPVEVNLPGVGSRVVGADERSATFTFASDRVETG